MVALLAFLARTWLEMPIVGGTGFFQLARGYAIAQTHWFDLTTGDAIVGYNITVVSLGLYRFCSVLLIAPSYLLSSCHDPLCVPRLMV